VAKEELNNSSPFASRLALLMRQRRLKHRELAEVVGVSKAAVGKWLRGTTPGAGELFKMARALGVTMESFFDAIPYVKPPKQVSLTTSPVEMKVKHLSAYYRKLYAGWFETFSTPEGAAAFHEAFRQMYMESFIAAAAAQSAQKEISKQVLTDVVPKDNIQTMQDEMQTFRARLTKATAARNQKAALAKWLGVSMSSVSNWLAGRKEPSGETTLRLLHWVEQQERQQNKSPSSAETLPEPKTQSKVSNEKKPQSSPQER
jgi:transcriptional regulator with XRE-family HTH domain